MRIWYSISLVAYACLSQTLILPTRILCKSCNNRAVSVEMFHSFTFLFSLLLLSPAEAADESYALPYQYFVNCGSKSDVPFGRRNFSGDQNYGEFSGGGSKPVKDTKPSAGTPELYQTARIFRRPCPYKFKITQTGTYLVRLHFFVFSSSVRLVDALFNVSAQPDASSTSWLSLLSNFSMKSSNESRVVKEFFLTIEAGNFVIYFVPSDKSCSAFVNAIEVFLAPTGFIPDSAAIAVNVSGVERNYHGLLSKVLQKAYRINVGGSNITEKADTLMRYWIPDDKFLLFPGSAKNTGEEHVKLEYGRRGGGSTEYIAPEDVYRTAKELSSNSKNITWRFKVNEHARHFVRAHFCDFVTQNSLDFSGFNFCINGNFCWWISADDTVNQLDAPFYADFVVDSGESGNIDVRVGPPNRTYPYPFLNGLEIMQVMENLSSSFVPPKHKKEILLFVAGSLGLAFVFIIIAVVIIRLVCMKKEPVKFPRLPSSLAILRGRSENDMSNTAATAVLNLYLELRIPFNEIRQATQEFDPKLCIGKGGFGKVYAGTLHGQKVAVKRREPGQKQGVQEFQTEIMVLSGTRHRNLVYLIGYCDERSEMILVYEFMEKGSLKDNLYDTNGCSIQNGLSWEKRLEICIGSATALHHLHTGSAVKIIHRDVKSTNILLDENYTAKVSDFGISKSSHPDASSLDNNTTVKGSVGYMDPEYFMSSELTEKSDVYSFGVVLLEVLCARPVIISSAHIQEMNIADWGLVWIKKGQLEKIIDPVLVDKINPNSLRIFGELVEKCLQAKGSQRPSMHDVLWYLEYALSLHTGISRDGLNESTTNASLQFGLAPELQHLPTSSFPVEENEEESIVGNSGSDTSASQVFSQLKFSGAR